MPKISTEVNNTCPMHEKSYCFQGIQNQYLCIVSVLVLKLPSKSENGNEFLALELPLLPFKK